jgi:hypothetical protein
VNKLNNQCVIICARHIDMITTKRPPHITAELAFFPAAVGKQNRTLAAIGDQY